MVPTVSFRLSLSPNIQLSVSRMNANFGNIIAEEMMSPIPFPPHFF